MAADLEELHEHAERGAADFKLAPVTISMAVLAVFVALASLVGARVHADAMLAQTRAADQWAQYQAERIRERSYEVLLDELSVFALQDPARAADIKAKYQKEIDHYLAETKDVQTQAYATENEVNVLERRSNWMDFSEVLLEASLVVCSITLLTQKRVYWYLGIFAGASGILIGVAGLLIR